MVGRAGVGKPEGWRGEWSEGGSEKKDKDDSTVPGCGL